VTGGIGQRFPPAGSSERRAEKPGSDQRCAHHSVTAERTGSGEHQAGDTFWMLGCDVQRDRRAE
jgi:hypothetical protein